MQSDSLISQDSFAQVQALAHQLAGLVLQQDKAVMISGRLSRRAAALGLPNLDSYCRFLREPGAAEEVPQFINALTTNHTFFFREIHHFEHLRLDVLPGLADRARNQNGTVRIWSAASSTGEEAYSTAATVRRVLGQGALPGLRILATDIDTAVLAKARRRRYPVAALRELPREWLAHLVAGGAIADHRAGDARNFEVAAATGALVTFMHLNLLGPWPMQQAYDVIFCRNVFIYFDTPTKIRLVERFAALLRPGGFLYLGHSDFLTGPHPQFRAIGRTIYRRVER